MGAFHGLLNMPEYVLTESFEYILSFKYTRILNMAEFWICKSYTGLYAAIWLNMSEKDLNIPEYVWT